LSVCRHQCRLSVTLRIWKTVRLTVLLAGPNGF
jgi:hypothetical protein